MMAEVQERRQQLGLTQYVEFLGAVQNPREMMRSAHVFLSTSRWEGMPLAALEAMSEGLCPVLSDVVGNQDIVENGHSGFLFRNIEEASEILRMVAQEAIATPLGLAAHQRVRAHFDVERMANKTYAVLSEAYTAPR